jgi:hypothetical protein
MEYVISRVAESGFDPGCAEMECQHFIGTADIATEAYFLRYAEKGNAYTQYGIWFTVSFYRYTCGIFRQACQEKRSGNTFVRTE